MASGSPFLFPIQWLGKVAFCVTNSGCNILFVYLWVLFIYGRERGRLARLGRGGGFF